MREKVLTFRLRQKFRNKWAFLKRKFRRNDRYIFHYCLETAIKIIEALGNGDRILIVSADPKTPEKMIIKQEFQIGKTTT